MNDNTRQCPKGINILVESVVDPAEAKGRKSRMRRLKTHFVPGDRILLRDRAGVVLFELSVNCFGKVSTVVPLDK